MKITVHIRPGAREADIEQIDEESYKVWVTSAPEKGNANAEMIRLLSEHFDVPKTSIKIIKGDKGREKVVEIPGTLKSQK